MTLYFAIVIWVLLLVVAWLRMLAISRLREGPFYDGHRRAIASLYFKPLALCFSLVLSGGLVQVIWSKLDTLAQLLMSAGTLMIPFLLIWGSWKAQKILTKEEVAKVPWSGSIVLGGLILGILTVPALLDVWSSN